MLKQSFPLEPSEMSDWLIELLRVAESAFELPGLRRRLKRTSCFINSWTRAHLFSEFVLSLISPSLACGHFGPGRISGQPLQKFNLLLSFVQTVNSRV